LVEDAEEPGFAWNYLPYYSSAWGSAGPLLEEMAAAGVEPCLLWDDGWEVQWWTSPAREVCMKAGASAPEAIARAWLKWKS